MSLQIPCYRQPSRSSGRYRLRSALRASAAVVMGLTIATTVLATPEKASSYYEDALKRYDKNEMLAAEIGRAHV